MIVEGGVRGGKKFSEETNCKEWRNTYPDYYHGSEKEKSTLEIRPGRTIGA